MAQIFDRSSNALARMSLILTGLIVIALALTPMTCSGRRG